jgi:hypothetical protein
MTTPLEKLSIALREAKRELSETHSDDFIEEVHFGNWDEYSECAYDLGFISALDYAVALHENYKEGDNNISPSHYKNGGIETIDYIRAKTSDEQFHGYLVGNIIKYISRFENKNGTEDLKKAQWYLNRLIDERTGKHGV